MLEKILILIQPNLIYAFRLIFEISEPSAAESHLLAEISMNGSLILISVPNSNKFCTRIEEILFF